MVEKNPELQVVCKASDGLEAVKQAQKTRPDLILIDVGLPKLNGIEAARQIREIVPNSKILFLSQNSDSDVVQRAFEVGAHGYVLKTMAGADLLPAVQAVIRGERFVSSGLGDLNDADKSADHSHGRSGRLRPTQTAEKDASYRHQVEFYTEDDSLLDGFARFVLTALTAGKAAIAIVTESHREKLMQKLLADKLIDTVSIESHYISVDAEKALSAFMVNGVPDKQKFLELVGELIAAAQAATGTSIPLAACGEGASILWAQGKLDAAIQLERFCDEIAQTHKINIVCGYLLKESLPDRERNEICERLSAEHY
jgi:CheY-like chemotaxis protein